MCCVEESEGSRDRHLWCCQMGMVSHLFSTPSVYLPVSPRLHACPSKRRTSFFHAAIPRYNVKLCVALGVVQAVLWVAWALRTRHPQRRALFTFILLVNVAMLLEVRRQMDNFANRWTT
jgi:Per1-like family